MTRLRFAIRYDPEVVDHVASLGKRWFGLIKRTIEERLSHEPDVETTNRKPLRKPSVLADAWELRFGPDNRFRAFYRVVRPHSEVRVVAVAEKRGNRLFIGGKEFTP